MLHCHLTFCQSRGETGPERSGKTLSGGWQLNGASKEEWDLARKKGKGMSRVTLPKQEVEQAGVRCARGMSSSSQTVGVLECGLTAFSLWVRGCVCVFQDATRISA